jgi:hypothetical protein
MPFKENLKAKIKLDRLLEKLIYTIREPPEKRWLDKALAEELPHMNGQGPFLNKTHSSSAYIS